MKKSLLLIGVLLFTLSGFANTSYNNYAGYNPYWYDLGYPNTATYGEIFTAPNTDTNLESFSFWAANPVVSGDILLGGYIATWTGSNAGTLLYSSPSYDYPNTGEAQISFNTGGVTLVPGQQYVMFLSVSQYYGQSFGQLQVDAGNPLTGLNGFAWYNNADDFNGLFTNGWDNYYASPDWAVDLEFTPEPSSLMLLGTGILGGLGILRRKLF